MAERKEVAKAADAKAAETKTSEVKAQQDSGIMKIQVVGPKDDGNGSAILRFNRDGRKQPIDLAAGQILTVGDSKEADITKDEAERLMTYDRWEFKEVEE